MMNSAKIQLILHYVMIILGVEFFETKAQVHHAKQGNQSRDVYYTTSFDQDISRRSRSSTELPVAFKAPSIESRNFWNYDPSAEPNRRTFFEDLKYLAHGSSNVFPNLNNFFDFMSPLFDRTTKPKPPSVIKPSEPYKYEYPFKYQSSTERNFLPPPKPLRASIVKLETVTKVPDWQIPFRYIPSMVRLTQPSSIPSQPTDQIPTLYIDELGFHSNHNINFRRDSNWIFQRTPGEPFDEGESTEPPLSTDLDFSVKSTPIRQEPMKNETYETTHISIEGITESPGNFKGESEDSVSAFTNNSPDHKNSQSEDEENSTKKLQQVTTNTVNKYNMNNNLKINRDNSNNIVSNTEKTELVKHIKPYKKSNTIKIVTDLTLEGLQKNKTNSVNVPRYTNLLNMSNLISYELNKLKQNKLMKPRSDFMGKPDKESYANGDGFVNSSDELSLDLKILKDTNWDGFTTVPPINFSSNTSQSGSETKLPDLDSENKSPNAQNSIENNENGKNQTIIVETRVTKSVSKLLPGKNRYNRRKYHNTVSGRDPRKEPDVPQMAGSDVGKEQRNLKIDIASEGTDTSATEDITIKTAEKNEKIQTEVKGGTFNRTLITLEKKYEISQESLTHDNEKSTEVTINYRSRKYSPYMRNRSSYYFLNNITETTALPNIDIIEQKDESLNSTGSIYMEGTNDYVTHTTTESPQTDNINAFVGKQIRRRKPKRISKSKRRSTGKRRKSSSTTQKQLIVEEFSDTV